MKRRLPWSTFRRKKSRVLCPAAAENGAREFNSRRRVSTGIRVDLTTKASQTALQVGLWEAVLLFNRQLMVLSLM